MTRTGFRARSRLAAMVGAGAALLLFVSPHQISVHATPNPSFCQGSGYNPDPNDPKCKLATGMAFHACVSGTPMYRGGIGRAYDLNNPRPCGVRRCGLIFVVRCGNATGTILCVGTHDYD